MNVQDNIRDKVVIITGASSGLGEATARLLAQRGARLVLAARRKERLDQLAAELRGAGAQVSVVAADVSRRADVDAIAAAALRDFGRIDVLVNNAGIMPLSPLDKLKVDEWERMIDVNIKGVLYGIAAVLPVMRESGRGHVINLSSVAGFKVFAPIGTVYSATKFAVRAISEGLRAEASAGIRSTIISPGAADSELKHNSSDADTSAGVKAFYEANQIPADAVARAIAYAIEQPDEVDINEIVIRPTVQEF
ncbi:SDR family oxidoreductase [Variovorax paradoxus]|nr:SDR family oxidoreductase [Variovorax paradoxus]